MEGGRGAPGADPLTLGIEGPLPGLSYAVAVRDAPARHLQGNHPSVFQAKGEGTLHAALPGLGDPQGDLLGSTLLLDHHLGGIDGPQRYQYARLGEGSLGQKLSQHGVGAFGCFGDPWGRRATGNGFLAGGYSGPQVASGNHQPDGQGHASEGQGRGEHALCAFPAGIRSLGCHGAWDLFPEFSVGLQVDAQPTGELAGQGAFPARRDGIPVVSLDGGEEPEREAQFPGQGFLGNALGHPLLAEAFPEAPGLRPFRVHGLQPTGTSRSARSSCSRRSSRLRRRSSIRPRWAMASPKQC